MKENFFPLAIFLGIIAIALFGGVKNTGPLFPPTTGGAIPSPETRQLTQAEIEAEIKNTQYKTIELQKKIALEEEAKRASVYKDKLNIQWGGWNGNANQEYIQVYANYSNTNPIKITGMKLVSSSTGQSVTIPQSTSLYFSNSQNQDADVWLYPGEQAYIITGKSPIGSGMRVNICSGYLSQFNTFNPNLYTSCPQPRNENLSSIPRRPINDNCFDLIDSYPSCRVQVEPLNNAYSPECQTFVYTKITYQSCVDTHKNDANFYSPKQWYVYLKRTDPLWKTYREVVTLYDESGKKVQTISR